jgi:hypothetical protein
VTASERDNILEHLRDFHERTGEIPTYEQWQRERDLPTVVIVAGAFGSWLEALEAAFPGDPELARRAALGAPRRWDHDRVISALRAFRQRTGRIPQILDCAQDPELPAAATAAERCGGTWLAALHLAFPGDPALQERYRGRKRTDAEVFALIRKYHAAHGFPAAQRQWDEWAAAAPDDRPAAKALAYRFGTLNEAWEAAGLPAPALPPAGVDEILDAIVRWADLHGSAPRAREWDASELRDDPEGQRRLQQGGPWPTLGAVRTAFTGGLREAIALTGLPIERQSIAAWDRETVTEAMRRWHELYGRAPRRWEWDPSRARNRLRDKEAWLAGTAPYRAGGWPHADTVLRVFRSWGAALEAAAVPLTPPNEWQRITAEDVVARIQTFIAEYSRPPRADEFGSGRIGVRGRLPGLLTVKDRCGSLDQAIDSALAAGVPALSVPGHATQVQQQAA